jgi:hypothetical protein
MVIDIGGGTTDVAVISLFGIVKSKNIRIAGDTLNSDIISYIRNEFKILVGVTFLFSKKYLFFPVKNIFRDILINISFFKFFSFDLFISNFLRVNATLAEFNLMFSSELIKSSIFEALIIFK